MRRRGSRPSSPPRRLRAARARPRACPAAISGASARIRFGCGKVAKIALRTSRSQGDRSKFRSICDRVSSISWSYRTPEGHAVTHAMHPRHWSMCVTSVRERSLPSSSPAFIKTIRPRGESISSSQSE